MKVVSSLLAYLGRAAGSRISTPEEGDTAIVVPGIMLPTLQLPFPVFTVSSLSFNPGDGPVNSFIFGRESVFNNNTSNVLFSIKPGLWRFQVQLKKMRQGAINDLTSNCRIALADSVSGSIITLCKIFNDVATPEDENKDFMMLVTVDSNLNFNFLSNVGLGTGTCLAQQTIMATRYF